MRSFIVIAPFVLLSACGRADHEPPVPAATLTPAPVVAPGDLPSVSADPSASAVLPGPTERDPRPAVAFWESAMERRDWTGARQVFGSRGAQSGLSATDFAAAWDKYRTIDVTVGQGEQDGAAGSSYYTAPVTIAAVGNDGVPASLSGTITLRRVNDVEGASAEQLRWHIESTTLRP